jgi:hypothetical protein
VSVANTVNVDSDPSSRFIAEDAMAEDTNVIDVEDTVPGMYTLLLPSDDSVEPEETPIDTPATVPTNPMLKPDVDDAAANREAPVMEHVEVVILTALSRML